MPSIQTSIAHLKFDEVESILHIDLVPGAEMDLEQTRSHYHIMQELTKGKPYIALVNAANYYNIDPEALRYSAQQNTIGGRVAAAHYNVSVANNLTVSFFKNQLKPGIPVGIFKTKEEALLWIAQLKEEGILSMPLKDQY